MKGTLQGAGNQPQLGIEWLLDGPPSVQYRTRLDLLDEPPDSPQVLSARRAMVAHPQVQGLISELAEWPGSILKSHKSAGHLLHKLTFVADLGVRIDDPGVQQIVERIFQHRSAEGPFQVLVNIHPRYGGTGEDQWTWMLCDAPQVMYALVKFGLGEDERVRGGMEYLAGLMRENGWPCAVAPDLGKFRGPGRKADPCPYANLVMLKVLGQTPQWRSRAVAKTGAETLLELWEQRQERRPYLFAMGEVLTHFPWLRDDERLREMIGIVAARADKQGRYTAESVWRDWKGWSFGQKRTASRWLTLIVQRMLKRSRKST